LRFLGGPVNKPIQAVDALFVRRQRWRAVASTSDHEEEEISVAPTSVRSRGSRIWAARWGADTRA
jgi:hypothetical protein